MNRATLGAAAGLLALAAAGAWSIARSERDLGPRDRKPALALLTSLPLVFGEKFGLDGGGSAALNRLEQRYIVQPIGLADRSNLKGRELLLMAHPRAQPAEALVELDQWIRDGGRLLLLADPRLDWPSERPLGDVLRPPPSFADTGLLAHWGLRLIAPSPGSAVTVGRLINDGECQIFEEGTIARCRIGKGRVAVIADADFLNVQPDEADNLDPLLAELDRLETR